MAKTHRSWTKNVKWATKSKYINYYYMYLSSMNSKLNMNFWLNLKLNWSLNVRLPSREDAFLIKYCHCHSVISRLISNWKLSHNDTFAPSQVKQEVAKPWTHVFVCKIYNVHECKANGKQSLAQWMGNKQEITNK